MTALSLELMDFTRDWVSSFVMLCQAFTAADFSCCLFVGLSAFSFVFSKWNACLIRLRSGDWLCHCRIFHFLPSKTPGLLYLYVLGHRPFVLWSATQSTLLHLIESVQRVYTLQNSSGCFCPLSSLNTSGPVPLEAMHAQAITLLHHVSHSQMMLYASLTCSGSKPSPYFFILIILLQVDLNFSRPKKAFPEVVWFHSGTQAASKRYGNAFSLTTLWITCNQSNGRARRHGDVATRKLKSTCSGTGVSFLSFSKHSVCVQSFSFVSLIWRCLSP